MARSRHASPDSTASTVYPSSRSTPLRALRTPASSSTIRMRSFMSAGQLDDEPRSPRRVVAHFDRSAVLPDDAPDDGEAEPAATALGRVVRHEQLLTVSGRHAGAVVGDHDARDRVRGVVLRLHDDAPARGFGDRLERVVDQVDHDAANLLDVEP